MKPFVVGGAIGKIRFVMGQGARRGAAGFGVWMMKSRFGMQFACAGVALAAAMACGAANAAPVVITNGQMVNPLIVNLSGSVYNGAVYDAAMQFTTTISGKPDDIIAFCVDIYHDITFGPYSPALQYKTNTFSTDSNPSPGPADVLTTSKILQIDKLVNYGTDVQKDGSLSSLTKSTTVAAVQGAIWQVVSGEDVTLASGWSQNTGVNATSFDLLVDNLSGSNYGTYLTGYGAIGDVTTFITPTNYPSTRGAQSFLFAGGVPEPSAWLLSIVGLGLVGGALRRRRRSEAAAATA